jgi:DNA-directed RNA polymerase I, II, and III subunit RPABC2
MFEEIDDIDNDYTNDNDFLEEDEDTTDVNVEDEEKGNEDNTFKILTYKNVLENIEKKQKKTIPLLTKFERARIVGVRLQQLAYGAKPRIDITNLKSINEIVEQELLQRKIPFIIRRTLPNSTYEDWKLEEFECV